MPYLESLAHRTKAFGPEWPTRINPCKRAWGMGVEPGQGARSGGILPSPLPPLFHYATSLAHFVPLLFVCLQFRHSELSVCIIYRIWIFLWFTGGARANPSQVCIVYGSAFFGSLLSFVESHGWQHQSSGVLHCCASFKASSICLNECNPHHPFEFSCHIGPNIQN